MPEGHVRVAFLGVHTERKDGGKKPAVSSFEPRGITTEIAPVLTPSPLR